MRIAPFCFSVVALVTLAACVSAPPPPEPVPQPAVEVVAPEPVPEPVVEPAQVPAEETPPVVEEPVFEVTPEKKQTTMAEIQLLVEKLNGIIARKSYTEWRSYLDREYIKTYGDPILLREYSANSPFLKQFNVKLKTLEDYFKFVVVPSRADTVVDDISFVDETRVNVWTIVDNEKVLLYLLKLYDKEWKISSW